MRIDKRKVMFYSISIAIIQINEIDNAGSRITRFTPKDIRHIMRYYNRQQHWGHNDNSLRNHDGARTRRTDRFDKPEAVNGRESIRPLVYPHAPTIVLVSCVQHARTGLRYKGFPAFTWLECKSSPRDAFPTGSRLYFFFPTMTMCTFPRAWNFWLCYKDQARYRISVGLKKVLHDRDQWGTSDPLRQCVFQNAWVIGILVIYEEKENYGNRFSKVYMYIR